jgi:PIN domain nuclease of toxin-antitoxin system
MHLYASPVSLMELQLLIEAGHLRLKAGASISELMEDDRWLLDEPPATKWFTQALDFAWTRDPFDRLLVAHARLRGWQLATADALLLEKLPARSCIEI